MSSYQRHFEEKRDFIRMQVNSDAILSINGTQEPAQCLDLSSTGMQLKTKAQARPGQQVQVEVVSQHEQLPGLKVTAQIIRVDNAEDGESYLLGLSIVSMS